MTGSSPILTRELLDYLAQYGTLPKSWGDHL
jgi:hypothetical protein